MQRPTIAFDVDDVLADLVTTWLNRYNKEYCDDLESEDIKAWDIEMFVKPECGKKIYDYIDRTIYDEMPPIKNALKSVEIARNFGRVIFVTNSIKHHGGAKYDWLEKNGFKPDSMDYVECRDKGLIIADVLIDDYQWNLERFRGNGLLFTQPWNREIAGFDRIDKFNEQFETILTGVLNGRQI